MEDPLNRPEDASPDALQSEQRELEAVIGLLGLAATPITPPARVKERLMRSLRGHSEPADATPLAAPLEVRPGISLIHTDELAWETHPSPGVRFKSLPQLPGPLAVRVLLELGPGSRFPDHAHDGVEELYVLRGSFSVAGRTLRAGDFCRSEAGTGDWDIVSEEGALVLVSTGPPADAVPGDRGEG